MSKKFLSSSALKVTMSVVVASMPILPAWGDCVVVYPATLHESIECACRPLQKACPEWARGLIKEDRQRPAGPGEAGYEWVHLEPGVVGWEYGCQAELSGMGLFLCAVGLGLCTVECAAAPTGVGVALCLSCLYATSAGCAWCMIISCGPDYSRQKEVFGDRWVLSGGPCVGQET